MNFSIQEENDPVLIRFPTYLHLFRLTALIFCFSQD